MTSESRFNEVSAYRFRTRRILNRPSARDLCAKVFEDQGFPGSWHVEKLGVDGATYRGAIFSGCAAREQSISYAVQEYGDFELATRPQQTYHWPI